MRLYVLRHAIAEDGAGRPDAERALTDEGREKLARVLAHAASRGVRPDRILTSPYVRALQTAQAAREALEVAAPLVETERLAPHASVADLWRELREQDEAEAPMIVGHNPLLSDLVGALTGDASLTMKKAALACLEIPEPFPPRPRGRLEWMLTAKTARGMGR